MVENGKETIRDITAEIPFDIPPNWTWCRLEYSCSVISTKNIQIKESEILKKGVIPVVTQSANFIEGFSNKTEKILKVIKPLVIFGDHTLNVKYVNFDFVVGADGVKILESKFHDNMFFYYSILWSSLLIRNRGYSRHFQFLKKKLLPLPPIEEQKRIVEAIENFTNNISSIDEEYSLIEEKISLTKSKLLDLAIRGKLLPQDANDEPASVLLDRIRKEKESSNKTTKGKRKAADSYIFKGEDNLYYEKVVENGKETIVNIDDEIPFDIPESWAWCRLGNLGEYKKGPFGSAITKSIFIEDTGSNPKVYEQKNAIYKNSIIGSYYITEEKFLELISFELNPDDIIVSCAGTIGETFIMPSDMRRGIMNQALMRVRLYNVQICKFYLIYFDLVLKKQSRLKGKGTAITNIPPLDILKKYLIPLPPLEEQKRISNFLDKAFEQLDSLIQH